MSKITLLDGGMGQELLRRSGDQPTPLWSAQVMIDHPGIVQAVHRDYFAAGATIATTNSYALHHDRLEGTPFKGHLEALIDMSLTEAQAARAAHGSGRIAGSIGPLVGSYCPDLHPTHSIAVPLYSEIARELANGCDLLICETVASIAHTKAVLEGAFSAGLPVYLALTVDALSIRRDLDHKVYADHAMGWIEQGATIVGGCCEVGPTHIQELALRLNAAGHEVV